MWLTSIKNCIWKNTHGDRALRIMQLKLLLILQKWNRAKKKNSLLLKRMEF